GPEGEVRPEGISRETIRPARNATYEEVDRQLQEGTGPAAERLRRLKAATDRMAAARTERGALTLHQPGLKIRVEEGQVALPRVDPATPARQMVSELMILVNRRGAEVLRDAKVPALYRMQNPPRGRLEAYEGPYDPLRFRREVMKMEKARLTLEPRP